MNVLSTVDGTDEETSSAGFKTVSELIDDGV